MRNIFILCLFMASFGGAIAQNTPLDAKAERAFLLEGVDKIPAVGTVGRIALSKTSAFPVLISPVGARATVVAASRVGKGRVVAFAHDGFFSKDAVKSTETCQLISNAIQWVARKKEKPIVLVRDLEDLATYLQSKNVQVKKLNYYDALTTEILAGVDVIITNPDRLDQEKGELALLKTALKNGKGGLFAGLGWGWKQLNPDKSLKTDFKGNLLLAEAGISWVDGYADSDTFQAEIELPALLSYTSAKKYVLENDFKTADKGDFSMALSTVLSSIATMKVANFAIPSDFPGDAPEGSPTVTKKITINTQSPYWHCTGLYAQAGDKITLTTQDNFAEGIFKVRIGAHTDELYKVEDEWKRMPEVSLAFDLQTGTNEVFNPFGGLIYIEVPENYKGSNLNLNISGAVEAPFFKLGQTSLADWTAKIRQNPAPWGEIEGKEFAFTIESSYLRTLDNPQEVAEFWDRIQAANKELVDWQAGKVHKMRLVFDRQIALGYMHSGYPIMALAGKEYVDEQANIINMQDTKKWGFVHELGHNHQEPAWTFDGTVEVTCNLFSMYTLEKVMNAKDERTIEAMGFSLLKKRWNDYVKGGKSFETWKKEPFIALIMYKQLVDGYGWEKLKAVFKAYHKLPENQHPENDSQKRDLWLKMYSQTVGEDLSGFFDAWNVPVSIEAKNSLKNLPKADLKKLMNL